MLAVATLLALFLALAPSAGVAQTAPQSYRATAGKPIVLTHACAEPEMNDFGLACSEDEPCPILIELSAIEAVGRKLFVTGNFHTDKATLASLLLATDDEGETWTEPYARQRAALLDLIQFVDFEIGWISGHSTGSLPRDPFLLKTSDGGKTWIRYGVYDENAIGVVDSFWFDSRTHGLLVFDRTVRGEDGTRYRLLESQGGGTTWMLREISPKPISSPRPKRESDLRIRAEASSKSYRIERRAGGKWSLVSAFSMSAGACKPAPPPEPPKSEAVKQQ